MPRTALYLALVVQAAAIQSLSAQVTDTTRKSDSLKATAQTLTGVTVRANGAGYGGAKTRTATKTDTPLRDVPQAATVLTEAFIADKQLQRVAEAMKFVPGITMASGEGHQDAAVIRGNSTTADFFVD